MKKINNILIASIVIIYLLAFRAIGVFAGVTTQLLAPKAMMEMKTETEIEETETEQPYSDDDFYELSHVIQAEAGYCEWDMMVGVGSVVLNRVKHEAFPNTIYEVIHQPGQYSCVNNGTFTMEPTEEVKEVTDYLLRNGSEYPLEVVYQANFPLGTKIYKTLSTSYSTMYFCYG